MAKIEKLAPGQTLWAVKRSSGTHAMRSEYSYWPVQVVEVNVEGGYIVAKFNGNRQTRMYERAVKTLRVKEPKS